MTNRLTRGIAGSRARRVALAFLLAAASSGARAQSVHWAYASFFGTGHYSLDGESETTVLRVSAGHVVRRAELDEAGARMVGIRVRVPFAIGAHEFDSPDLFPSFRFESVNSFSIVPGVEIDVPIASHWNLKPMAYVGWGTETGGDVHAAIFRLGLRSERVFEPGSIDVALYNSLLRMGYSANDDSSDAVNLFEIGLDFSRALANRKLGGAPVEIHWHALYTRYFDEIHLDSSDFSLEPAGIDSEWEIGAGFGRQGERLGLWRIRFDRVGLAYRFDSDGQFSGVGIVFKSLFDR
jgi:hypothetical protein